jgi:N-acetylmuramoyl-L-alanine amidase
MKNIILDFGHGGIDSNGNYTTAPSKMFEFPNGEIAYEGVINRQIGGHLALYLKTHNEFNVVPTVKVCDPRDISLSYRVGVANQYNATDTIFVSIHSNASQNHNASGFSIFTTRGVTKSDELATCIGKEVERYYNHLNLKLRFDFSDRDLDKETDFYVLRRTRCPAVLLECLFFDYWNDYVKLKDPEFQKELAWRIYKGIIKYLNKV